MKRFIYISLILFLQTVLIAGNNKDLEKNKTKVVVLQITDEAGESVTGAKIKIEGFDKELFTDFEGKIQLSINASNNAKIEINSIGYTPLMLQSTSLSTFTTLSLNKLN